VVVALTWVAWLLITGLIIVTLAYRPIQRHAIILQVSHLSIFAAALMLAAYTS
jgi:hypothetical protein